MSASTRIGHYECEFMGAVSEDFVCGLCKYVAYREPHVTSCCSETFCRLCITSIIENRKPCPACKNADFSALFNVKYQRRILALEVRCTMKDRGCEWTGKLEGLEAHLDADTGDCEYVDVKCPNRCDQPVEKHTLPTHLANSCPKREFTCQYCNFKATYEVVSNDHWPQCSFYPVPCPNACGIQAIERGDLEAHLQQCPLEEVECDFSHAGCHTKLLRQDMERHVEEGAQKHLVLMSALTLGISRKFEQKLQEQREELHTLLEEKDKKVTDKAKEKDEKIAAMEARLQQKDVEMREMQRALQEADQRDRTTQEQLQAMTAKMQITQQQLQSQSQRVETLERYMGIAAYPPTLEMLNFKKHVAERKWWYSRPLYTHPGGYKMCIGVNAYGSVFSDDRYVVACFYSMQGEFDRYLQWPAKRAITLQLLNQEREDDHVSKTEEIEWSWTKFTRGVKYFGTKFIAHSDLDYSFQKQTRYLVNDSLWFRVTTEVISL